MFINIIVINTRINNTYRLERRKKSSRKVLFNHPSLLPLSFHIPSLGSLARSYWSAVWDEPNIMCTYRIRYNINNIMSLVSFGCKLTLCACHFIFLRLPRCRRRRKKMGKGRERKRKLKNTINYSIFGWTSFFLLRLVLTLPNQVFFFLLCSFWFFAEFKRIFDSHRI